jgi:hypothetical protein
LRKDVFHKNGNNISKLMRFSQSSSKREVPRNKCLNEEKKDLKQSDIIPQGIRKRTN